MTYFVYILYSESLNRYYIGSTQNIAERMQEHLWKHKGFTSKAKDWIVKYTETHTAKTAAIKRENQIKKWKSRVMIEKLIDN